MTSVDPGVRTDLRPAPFRSRATAFADALSQAVDLVLPRECAGCGRPGFALCPACRVALSAEVVHPFVAPVSGLPLQAAAHYAGVTRAALLAHKEHRQTSLAVPLGRVLAAAVSRSPAVIECGAAWLIAVPSGRGVDRVRGARPLAEITGQALRTLRKAGYLVGRCEPVASGRRNDQVGLSVEQRWSNLTGSMRARAFRVPAGIPILLVDDIVTSGATLTELARALQDVGRPASGAAVIAAAGHRVAGPSGSR